MNGKDNDTEMIFAFAGEKHELLPATENKPGIVVHICDEPEGSGCKQRICQTPCPKRI